MFYESDLEKTIIDLLVEIGYEYLSDDNPWIVERELSSFINEEILYTQLKKINKNVSDRIINEVIRQVKNIDNPSLFERNKIFHEYLINGITIGFKTL